jgi:hypothetical protein
MATLPRAETRGDIKDGDSSKRGQKHVVVSKMATPVKEVGNTWWYQRWRLNEKGEETRGDIKDGNSS